MAPIYVLASLCVVGIILIAVVSMAGRGGGANSITQERMERRQAKLDRQDAGDDTPAPTPLPTASGQDLDDAA